MTSLAPEDSFSSPHFERRLPPFLPSIVVILFVLGVSVGSVAAQEDADDEAEVAPPKVVRIVFEGLEETGVSESLVREQMETRVGEPFEEDVLEADYQRLWKTLGLIVTAPKARYDAEAGGLEIKLTLRRTFSIDLLAFEGNTEKTDSELDDVIGIANPSRVRSRRQLELAAQRIVETYREDGYAWCQVDLNLDRMGENRRAVFLIFEGPRVSVEEIRFEGLVKTSDGELRDVMETGESWFIFNQYYREERLNQDLTAIEGYLRSRGYLDAKVSLEDLEFFRRPLRGQRSHPS